MIYRTVSISSCSFFAARRRRAVFGFSEAKPVSVAFRMRYFIFYSSLVVKKESNLYLLVFYFICVNEV